MAKRKPKIGRRLMVYMPWPPSINDYYGNRRGGGRYLLPHARAFRRSVGWLVSVASDGWGRLPITGPVRVQLQAFPPDRRRYDLDNREKAIFDALEAAGVIKDDSQVVEKAAKKMEPVTGGAYLVIVEELL